MSDWESPALWLSPRKTDHPEPIELPLTCIPVCTMLSKLFLLSFLRLLNLNCNLS
jgi:hypothetical protein